MSAAVSTTSASHSMQVESEAHGSERTAYELLPRLVTLTNNIQSLDASESVRRKKAIGIDAQKLPLSYVAQRHSSMALLKQLHRELCLASARTQKRALEKKAPLDSLDLQHQSLQYEKAFVMKEIGLCEDFKYASADPELCSLDTFKANAPDSLQSDDVLQNAHQLQLNRLHFESIERKRLANEVKVQQKLIVEIRKEINDTRGFLKDSCKLWRRVVESSKPIEAHLSLPRTSRIPDKKLQFLPQPLFTLFESVSMYRHLYDKTVDVWVEGEAHSNASSKGPSKTGPYSVVVQFTESTAVLELVFRNLTALPFVSVMVRSDSLPPHLLVDLFEQDKGSSLPHSQLPHAEPIDTSVLGYTFFWAQSLCGLQYPRFGAAPMVFSVRLVFPKIRQQLQHALVTQQQLKQCHMKKIPVVPVIKARFPHFKSVLLSSFSEINHATFRSAKGVASTSLNKGRFFQAVFTHSADHSRMNVFFQLFPNHPTSAPLFRVVLLSSPSQQPNRVNLFLQQQHSDSRALAMAMSEGNCYYGVNEAHAIEGQLNSFATLIEMQGIAECNILPAQLYFAQMSFAILKLSAGLTSDKHSRLLLRRFRGRNRRLPLLYDQALKSFVHRIE